MLFRTIVNSTKILFIYLLIQLPSPKIKIPQNSNVNELNSRLTASGKSFRFGITADGEFGYHKEVEGADTVIPFSSGKIMDVDYSLIASPTIIEIDLTLKKALILVDRYNGKEDNDTYYCDLIDSSIWGKEITWGMSVPGGSSFLYLTLDTSKKQLSIRVYHAAHNNQHHLKKIIVV